MMVALFNGHLLKLFTAVAWNLVVGFTSHIVVILVKESVEEGPKGIDSEVVGI